MIVPLELAMGITTASPPSKRPKVKGEKELDSTLGPFVDFCKQRFLWYREQYKKAIQDGIDDPEICPGQPFPLTLFECHDNSMSGQWNYHQLMSRFEALEKAIMKETNEWPSAGLKLEKKESGLAVSLRAQRAQIVSEMAHRSNAIFDLALIDENPFLWRMTYFGRSGTPVDDGVFKIKIHISPNHPEVQPRVYMETPLFHVRVATDQMLIYLPVRADEMIRHIEGILSALEEKWPICNPLMVVNQERARLCWGNADDKKEYTRRLRRSVADSLEYVAFIAEISNREMLICPGTFKSRHKTCHSASCQVFRCSPTFACDLDSFLDSTIPQSRRSSGIQRVYCLSVLPITIVATARDS